MKFLRVLLFILACAAVSPLHVARADNFNFGPNGSAPTPTSPIFVLNGTAGTTLNSLAKHDSVGKAVSPLTTDTIGVIGIVTAGAGNNGTATIYNAGVINCNFDGATTAGDWVTLSNVTGGDCTDAGSAPPYNTQILGHVISTNASAGLYQMVLQLSNRPNGHVNVLDYGVVCDGSTDNNPSTSGPLQTAINAAGQIASTGQLGVLDIPTICNGNSGHQLNFSTGVTVPSHVAIQGLGAACYDTDPNCITLNYVGTGGIAILVSGKHSVELRNFKLNDGGSGLIGIQVDGSFRTTIEGVSVIGFTGDGIDLSDNIASSIYNRIINSSAFDNGAALVYDGTLNSSHAVGGNLTENSNFWGSTGTYNVVLRSFSTTLGTAGYQNVYNNHFDNTDISQAGESVTIGILSTSTLNTVFTTLTAESLLTTVDMDGGTNQFTILGGEGATLANSTTGPVEAAQGASYHICLGYVGGPGTSNCYNAGTNDLSDFHQSQTFRDQTGESSVGQMQNLMKNSDDFSQSSWTTSGMSSVTGGAAQTPYFQNGGATQIVVTPSGTSYVQQTATGLGSVAGHCFTGMVHLQTTSGTARVQLQLTDGGGSLAVGGLSSGYITTQWMPFEVNGCASDSSTSVTFRPIYFSANAPSVTINAWGASVVEQPYPGAYIDTGASAMATHVPGFTSVTGFYVNGQPAVLAGSPALTGGGTLATGSNSFVGSITNAAASGNVMTPNFTEPCAHEPILILSDRTTPGTAHVTASTTTNVTFSATAADTVDYMMGCR